MSSSSSTRTDSSTETEDFVEEAPAVEELAEAAAVRKAEEDWSKLCKFIEERELTSEETVRNIRRVTMEGEKDGPLE